MLQYPLASIHPGNFDSIALRVFQHQYRHNPTYQRYVDHLGIAANSIKSTAEIPFLPITLFKSHSIQTGDFEPEIIFTSSGTTGTTSSHHRIRSVDRYRESFLTAFERFYGNIENYCILALLPNYLERDGSSLILMAKELIERSKNPDSNFYLYDHDLLLQRLKSNEQKGQNTLLLGVTFALLDLAERCSLNLQHTIVMETGGMKGQRKEITRAALHKELCTAFSVKTIHAEYGMTELLSQAYSKGDGLFHCPPWMRVLIRDTNDPLSLLSNQQTGGLNIIDLANTDSCAFIATQDLGMSHPNGQFEVLGRFDTADIRGCNLMIA